MPENNLRIVTEVYGIKTVGDLANEIKKAKIELKGMAIASDEVIKKKQYIDNLKGAYSQLTYTTSGFTKLIKEERAEQRQVNFAMREGLGAMAAMGLQGKVLNEVVGGSVSAFSGLSFAIKAMNTSFATLAVPIAAIGTAFFLFNKILSDSESLTSDLNKSLTEQARLLKEAGLATSDLLRKRLQLDLLEAQKKFKEAGGGISWESYVGYATEGRKGIEKAWKKEQTDAYNEVIKLITTIKKLDEEDAEAKQKSTELYLDTLKKISNLEKDINKDKKEAAAKIAKAEAERYDKQFGRTGSLQANLGNISPIGRPGSAVISQPLPSGGGETSNIRIAMAQFSAELQSSATSINDFKYAMWSATDSLAQSFMGLMTGATSLSETFVNFGKSILNMLAQMASQELAKSVMGGVLGLFGLAKGGDVTPGGGSLSFAGSGGSYRYGKTQNVIVGERAPELMQVGMNGVRVIPMNKINQMGTMSRYGSGGQQYHVSVHPIVDNQGLAMQVIIGNNQRNQRIMKAR